MKVFFEGTNIDIIIVTIAATGDIKKKVECQPKVWIMLAPNKSPSTDPAEYAELNTPIAIESFSTGNTSRKILNATGTAANPTPWTILDISKVEMLFVKPPAIIPEV